MSTCMFYLRGTFSIVRYLNTCIEYNAYVHKHTKKNNLNNNKQFSVPPN